MSGCPRGRCRCPCRPPGCPGGSCSAWTLAACSPRSTGIEPTASKKDFMTFPLTPFVVKYSALAKKATGRGISAWTITLSRKERWLGATMKGPSLGTFSRPMTVGRQVPEIEPAGGPADAVKQLHRCAPRSMPRRGQLPAPRWRCGRLGASWTTATAPAASSSPSGANPQLTPMQSMPLAMAPATSCARSPTMMACCVRRSASGGGDDPGLADGAGRCGGLVHSGSVDDANRPAILWCSRTMCARFSGFWVATATGRPAAA